MLVKGRRRAHESEHRNERHRATLVENSVNEHRTPMTTTDPIERHANHSREMLDQAAEMIAQGDRLQASKQIWGAAAAGVSESSSMRRLWSRGCIVAA